MSGIYDDRFQNWEGRPKTVPTNMPSNHHVKLDGGESAPVIMSLTANDPSKSVDMTWAEDVYIFGAILVWKDAPLGASIDLELVHPQAGVVATLADRAHLLGTGQMSIQVAECAKVTAGLYLRFRVNNADGQGDADAAAAFKVAGTAMIYEAD